MQKATISITDCAKTMRLNGISCSPKGIGDAIEHGDYLFGRIKSVGNSGRRAVEIFRVDFYNWLATKVGGNVEKLEE